MHVMTTTHLRKLLLAAVCLFTGLTAQAQFSATLEQYARSNYNTDEINFSLTEVATQLGTDTVSLMNAVRSWNSEGSTDASMFFYKEADGNFSDHYTQGGKGGFWIQGNGMVGEWPNVVFYNTIGWDSENDLFTISIGQFPDSLSAGATFNPQFKLVLGEKEATFDITYIVKPIPEVAAPTTLVEKDLNVVGETTLEVKQFPRSGTNGTTYEFEIEDLLEKLEMPSSELLSLVLSKIIYSPERDPAIGDKKDTLTNNSTASAPGWWLSKQTEDEHGNISDEVLAAPYNTDGEVYYTEQFKFEDNKLSFVLGQHGNALKAGDSYYNNVYIIYNDKAYRIRIQLTIEEADYSGLDDMTKTGETIIEKEQGIDDSYNYDTVSFTLDTDAIAAELGCEKNQLSLQVLDANNNLTSSGTANNGGFWMTADGVACGWGNSAVVFVEPVTAGDLSTLNIGHYPGNLKVGDEVRFNMYIVNEGKYHLLDILYKVKDKEAEDQSGYKIVATRNAVVQVIAHATEYIVNDNQSTYTLKLDDVNELIGTTSPSLYCELADTITAATGEKYAPYTRYLCTPAPGVWLGKDGQGHNWTGNAEAPVGICYSLSNGQFTVYQAPGVNAVGSAYKTNLYLVNEETKEMIQVKFTVQFVSELVSFEIVGEESLLLPLDMDDFFVNIDVSKAANALGITTDELMNGYNLKGMNDAGLYSAGFNPIENGCSFNISTGGYDELGKIHILFIEEGEGYVIDVISDEEVENGYKTNGAMCFEIDSKRYVYNLTFVDPDQYTGISNIVEKSSTKDKIYDLSGRSIKKPLKGIYIQNGKKYVVK